MFEFAWPYVFALLPLPLIVRLLWPAKQQQQSAALLVPSFIKGSTGQQQAATSSRLKLLFATIIWILLITAAARPQWLGEPVSIPNEGRDLMIAVDLSGSMKMEDMEINGRLVDRLVMTKSVLTDFIKRRVGDRLGLILFADTAYLQAPLTFDRETVATLLDETVIGLVGEKTAIGDAIGLAVKRFDDREDSNRVLVLMTDGQNTAGRISPEEANELAKNFNVKIYTIGLGADEKVINSFFGQRRVNPSADLDEALLTRIAESTGGEYFRARDPQSLENIYKILDQLEPVAGEGQKLRPLTALFYVPLIIALGLSALYALITLLGHLFNRLSMFKSKQNDENKEVA
jgi:Ca-activated chloride channel family protein